MSLEMQIEGLQISSKHQKQKNMEENMKRRKRRFVIFCFKCFEFFLQVDLWCNIVAF